ncbi:MAG: 16S rRNA (guanine(527)-N(7))-methyltransferase RsmG [Rhodobacteraceae bacterium]|nr:MAG: 16S rRNA (guanine(527)-N(7))-methyltransferase RsmG [Paracoccaceae bacterium]
MPTQEELLARLDVSRETRERLQIFHDLVVKWTGRINLISKSSIPDLWPRHILDSVQVFRAGDAVDHWVDIGSGGGFPGLVVAICARVDWPDTRFTLIESDQRKAAFLRTAVRELGLSVTVLDQRIESAPPQAADILSARALSDLAQLLVFVDRHLKPEGVALFQKGASWRKEVDAAKRTWSFRYRAITSLTDEDAVILRIEGIAHG